MKREIYKIISNYLYGDNVTKLEMEILKKISKFIHNKRPIEFVLPSFPGKSPNINSSFDGTFGYEEKYSINVIQKMLNDIKNIYPFGAKIYIIHDGHLFTDLSITRSDEELHRYIAEFRKNINPNIISVSLLDLTQSKSYSEARNKFKRTYVNSLNEKELSGDLVQKEILFTKIEFESQITNNEFVSKNQLQMKAKEIAKQSLLRKNGLSICIDEKYRDAIRLSIHYQNQNSHKLGFKLIDKAINLGSPWFNIIYECSNGDIILGKRNWFVNERILINNENSKYYKITEKAENEFKSNNVNKIMKKEISIGR